MRGDDGFDRFRPEFQAGGPLIRVLGPCRADVAPGAEAGEVPTELSLVQRRILVRLALARPGSADAEALTEAVWGRDPPATARTSLHNQISRIRSHLGSGAILTEAGRYSLTVPTDVEVATELLDSSERSIADERFVDALQSCEAALALWRGEPLAELSQPDEVFHERRRLFEVHRSLETLRLEATVGVGRVSSAIPEAERLVAATPFDERRWVLLIRSLELAGRRGDALGACERARRTLAEQVGIGTGPALRAAESSILGIAASERTVNPAPFVGREDFIDSVVDCCAAGGPVLVVGDAGVGKSRVLEKLGRHFRRKGSLVAVSSCSLHPDTAVTVLRELADGLGVALDANLPPVETFVSAVGRLVDSSGEVVLIVDDIDLAGPTTAMAMQAVAVIDGLILIAAATDTVLLSAELTAGGLTLESLSDPEQAELADHLLSGQEAIGEEKLKAIMEMSGGNPAILEHMLDHPLWPSGSETVDAARADDPVTTPALRDVVRRRLERFDITTRSTLEIAAVCGPSTPTEVLCDLTSERGVTGAITVSLLTKSDDDDGRSLISFRHGVVRKILYDDLSPGRRLEIHHRAADLLRTVGASAAAIATHSLASAEMDPRGGVEDAFTAARETSSHGAHADAAQWYERAIAVAESMGVDERVRVEALVGLADALRLAGSPDQEVALFAAADAAFDLDDQRLVAEAAFAVLQLGATTESGSLHLRAVELAERALSVLVEPDQRARVAGAASLTHSMAGDPVLCRELFVEAEAAATSTSTRLQVLPFAYLGLGHPRDLAFRERVTDEMLSLGREDDDPTAIFEGLHLSFSVGLQRGDGERVRSTVAASAQLMKRVGDVGRRWSLAYQQAAVAHLDGDLDLAEAKSEEALSLFGAVSPTRALAAYGGQILMIRIAQKRLDELTGTIEALMVEQPGVPAWHAPLALALAPHDPDRARHHGRVALDDVAEGFTWLAAHLIGGRAAAVVGDDQTKARYVARLAPYSGLGSWQGTCSYGPVDTVLALLHRANGDCELADHHLHEAQSCARRLVAPVFEAELEEMATTWGT